MGIPNKKIVTHISVDLDAVMSVLCCIEQGVSTLDDVSFLPANTTEKPQHLHDAVFVDMPIGIKGSRSALAEIPGSRKLLGDDFVDEIDDQDGVGMAIPRYNLGQLFGMSKQGLKAMGFKGEALDRQLLMMWQPILIGAASRHRQYREAKEHLEEHGMPPTVVTGPYRWAVPKGAWKPLTSLVLAYEHDYTGSVYETGYGLGVNRFFIQHTPNLNRLSSKLEGRGKLFNKHTRKIQTQKWFVHEAGHLVAWGSRKAPINIHKYPPPKNTPRSQDELVSLLKETFAQD